MSNSHTMHTLARDAASMVLELKDWEVHRVSDTTLAALTLERDREIIGAFISGSVTEPKSMNGIKAVAGMDIIIREDTDKLKPTEPDYNIYHVVFEVEQDSTVKQWGKWPDTTILPHWPRSYTKEQIFSEYENLSKGSTV